MLAAPIVCLLLSDDSAAYNTRVARGPFNLPVLSHGLANRLQCENVILAYIRHLANARVRARV